MKIEYMMACPYCGQMRTFESEIPGIPEDEQRTYVAEHCTCEEAEHRRCYRKTKESIDKILGSECVTYGFDYECSEEVIALVLVMVRSMIENRIDHVSFKEPNGDIIKLDMGSDRVKISRVCKKQITM